MIAIITALASTGVLKWVGIAIGAVVTLIGVWLHGKSAGAASTAAADQTKVSAAQSGQNLAEQNLADRKTAEAEANAQAAQSAADAAKERTNAENAQAALSDDAARSNLLSLLSGAGTDNPGAGQGSPGDKNRR